MHRALRLLDILTILFDGCSNETLASAARTCKSWQILALQRLWRVLETPLPLLWLLGFDDWENTKRVFDIDFEALPRLQFYARFVQSITVHSGYTDDSHIHPRLIGEFAHMAQFLHPHLFPHLVSLDCLLDGPEAIWRASFWLGIRLSKISLSLLDCTEAACLLAIRSLSHHGAFLTSLSLHLDQTSEFSEAVIECFVNALKPLVNLVCLTANWEILFTPTVWTCIAQFPNLKEVRSSSLEELDADPPDPSAWYSFEPPTLDTPFPSLHTIAMAVPSQLSVIVLGYYPLDGVRFLGLLLTDKKDDPLTEQSLTRIVTICKGLHELLLVAPNFSLPVLKLPLLPNLTHLTVCTNGVETINNADLVDLGSKMPNLEDLGLIPVQVHDPPSLTLEVIRAIAGVCPRLGRASLYVNTDVSDIRFSFDDPPLPSNHPLSTLCFAPSPVQNCCEVAMYLCTVFQDARHAPTIMAPEVSFEQHFSWEGLDHRTDQDPGEGWKYVAEFMGTLRRRIILPFQRELEALRGEVRFYTAGKGPMKEIPGV
ncbi:uncharacterized protein EI90DRAFT_3290502 [Cantharellus anzutake]|uniref:uncharacterized protein n=1 Tax=Cantharellus anzutake TaxID=1750568 RepID=UPI0019078775|nr:uncharacterized protein EI90DRAFT_3290502 [Cantharellus anzutake]KAF8328572.1 hypothetical protein EI90DRAFT_3290502 [Cantharellus anzutake]